MIKNYIPNILTLSRIIFVPFFLFYLLVEQNYVIACIIFIVASATDWADGYFARKFNIVTNFGIFFDPLADKLLVLSAFYSFLYIQILETSVLGWMIIIILFRDISITLLRIIINLKGDYVLVTSRIAKLKTFFQIGTIIFILICLISDPIKNVDKFSLIYYSMVITTFITFYTGIHYYYTNVKQLREILLNK